MNAITWDNIEEIVKSDEIKTLPELFFWWREAHKLECDDSTAKYREYKDEFAEDGYICENEWNNTDKKVLYILKEPNWEGYTSNKNKQENDKKDDMFWFRKVVLNKGKLDGKTQGGHIGSKLRRLQRAIDKDEYDFNNLNWDVLRKTAYMNLSKRGGGSHLCKDDKERLHKYCEKYKLFIEEEIKILKPTIIVCCGTFDFIDKAGINLIVKPVKLPHPSRGSNKGFVEMYFNSINKI